jgi:hypothetical protein
MFHILVDCSRQHLNTSMFHACVKHASWNNTNMKHACVVIPRCPGNVGGAWGIKILEYFIVMKNWRIAPRSIPTTPVKLPGQTTPIKLPRSNYPGQLYPSQHKLPRSNYPGQTTPVKLPRPTLPRSKYCVTPNRLSFVETNNPASRTERTDRR